MVHETQTPRPEYDHNTPITKHANLTEAQFREFFEPADGAILNVGAGHSALVADLRLRGIRNDVVALDPSYKTQGQDFYQGYKKHGFAQNLEFSDNTFAVTVAHFVMQHLPEQRDISDSIKEMIRVTRPVDDIKDDTAGTILIGPVFDVPKLTELIFRQGFEDVSGIQFPPTSVKHKAAMPSLIIKKTPALTTSKSDRISLLADMVAESGALTPRRREAGERLSRLFRGRSSK